MTGPSPYRPKDIRDYGCRYPAAGRVYGVIGMVAQTVGDGAGDGQDDGQGRENGEVRDADDEQSDEEIKQTDPAKDTPPKLEKRLVRVCCTHFSSLLLEREKLYSTVCGEFEDKEKENERIRRDIYGLV